MLGAVPSLLISGRPALAMPTTTIRVGTRVIEVNGRPATVFGLTLPDGSHGLITEAEKSFRVRLENQLDEETLIHWHGLTPPWQQDGVPELSQAPLGPGQAYDYDFPLDRPGTNWMYSHHGLQEQREPDRRHTVIITEAPGYVWRLNGATDGDHAPLDVRAGERVEITFEDRTTMAHPMHLHGHHFQVVAINGERFAGAMRDTVLVPSRGNVTIAFEANNPGKWALHCHHLYHMASGMMTTLEYRS